MITNFNPKKNVRTVKLNKSEQSAISTTLALCTQLERDAPEAIAKAAKDASKMLAGMKLLLDSDSTAGT